ncbi:beta-ketoacyl synthase N-terminal-like domain-containing protein [Lachnospiraceae bacterium 54-53]
MGRTYIKDILCLYPDAVSGYVDSDCFLQAKEKRKLDRYSQISLAVCKKIHACNPDFFENGEDISVITATCFGALNTMADETARYHDTGMVSPVFITKILSNMQAAVIAIALKLKGTNYTVSTGVNSSCDAVIDGYELIKENREMHVLVAGSDSCSGEYGKAMRNNYTGADVEDFGECGAAVLLDSQAGSGVIGEITDVYRGILHEHEQIWDRLMAAAGNEEAGSHGIYFKEKNKLVHDLPLSSGSQTIFDLKKGIEYCRLYNEKEFFVYSISKKRVYSAIRVTCIPG